MEMSTTEVVKKRTFFSDEMPLDFKILDKNGGWLSKPFLYQGNKTLVNELKTTNPLEALLDVGKDFIWQDSVLYTAPEKSGKYKVEVKVAK